jgi:UDPglucose--hexose-1-phosphate uridylyltransferase
MIVPLKHYQHIKQLNKDERISFAEILKDLTTKFDNLFETSFPYSSGIHQSPTDGDHPEWHFHMSFYPPLLRSATVKKFMVGYEMFANPQRDITAEQAADTLKSLDTIHFTQK